MLFEIKFSYLKGCYHSKFYWRERGEPCPNAGTLYGRGALNHQLTFRNCSPGGEITLTAISEMKEVHHNDRMDRGPVYIIPEGLAAEWSIMLRGVPAKIHGQCSVMEKVLLLYHRWRAGFFIANMFAQPGPDSHPR